MLRKNGTERKREKILYCRWQTKFNENELMNNAFTDH